MWCSPFLEGPIWGGLLGLCKQSGNFSSSSIIGWLWGNILRYQRFYNFPLFRVYTFPGTILSSHFWEFSQDKRQLSLNVCIVYCIQYVIYNRRHICISMNEAFILRYTCASGPIKRNLPTSVFMPSQYWVSVNESCLCYFQKKTQICNLIIHARIIRILWNAKTIVQI